MSRSKLICKFAVLAALGLGVAPSAFAAVSLLVTDGDTTPSSASLTPGQQFTVTLQLQSGATATTDRVTGFDTWVGASASNVLKLISRNTTVQSTYDYSVADASVPQETLSPNGSTYHGATLASGKTAPANNTTVTLATFTFQVLPGAANQSLTLFPLELNDTSPPATPNFGYYDLNNNINRFTTVNATFPATGQTGGTVGTSFQVNVVPEPSMALVGAGLLGALTLRRKRSVG